MVRIANGIGITGYRRTMPRGFAGQPAHAKLPDARAYRVPKRKQINNIAISGFGADTDSITVNIELPNGEVLSYTTTRESAVPADDAAAAQALVDAINGDSGANSARGVVVATRSTANVILTFVHEGVSYDVTTSVVNAVATVTETQGPAGTSVPIGRFVMLTSDAAIDGQRAVQLPTDATAAQIRGIVLRELSATHNAGSTDPDDVDTIPPGSMCSVAYNGAVLMKNAGTETASEGEHVWVVTDADATAEIGECMGVPAVGEGGVLQVATVTPGAGQNSVPVAIEITITGGQYAGATKTLSFVTDADMTATEVADAFRTDLNADALFSALLVDSGTATLILTAATPDITFDVNALQGTFTIDNATTAADDYAVELTNCYWAEDTAPGEIGAVFLRI